MTALYAYQTLHLRAGHPLHTAAHVAELDRAAQRLFGQRYAPDLRTLERRIAAVAVAERYPDDLAAFVRIELTEGAERIVPGGVSLYEGYALRSLMPDAATLVYDLPLDDCPTSAREAVGLLARAAVRRSGATEAVQCDAEGHLRSVGGAPLFAVARGAIFALTPYPSLEQRLVLRAAERLRMPAVAGTLTRDALEGVDELFWADHRGITALAHCDGYPLMSLTAERIAAALEEVTP